MKRRRPFSAPPTALALLALAACSTEEVAPPNVVRVSNRPRPASGLLFIGFSPIDPTPEARAARFAADPNWTSYDVLLDGRVVEPEGGGFSPFSVTDGTLAQFGYLDAGPHHFTIGAPASARIFEGDGDLPDGATTYLFLFGPLDGVQGRFVSLPTAPGAGNEHVTIVNLVRAGQTVELVSCRNAWTCTPISPALALGTVFDTEVPAAIPNDCPYPCPTSLTADGVGIGYRVTPSASVPNPPVLALARVWDVGTGNPTAMFIAAPVYLSDLGQSQGVFF